LKMIPPIGTRHAGDRRVGCNAMLTVRHVPLLQRAKSRSLRALWQSFHERTQSPIYRRKGLWNEVAVNGCFPTVIS
jgi:hypothetical protein